MTDLSITCLGGDSVAWQAEFPGKSQRGYLEKGSDFSVSEAFVVILSSLEGGAPRISIESRNRTVRIDLYRVGAEQKAARLRAVMPLRSRTLTLGEDERILVIPVQR